MDFGTNLLHPKDGEDTVFSVVCLSTLRRDAPSSSHNTLASPMSFPGKYRSDWSQVPFRGYPSPRHGVPQSQAECNHSQAGGSPVQGGGVSPGQDRTGQDWGTTPPNTEVPPQNTEDQKEYLVCGGRYASCIPAEGLS